MESLDVNACDLLPHVTLRVRVHGLRRMQWRIKVGLLLMRLAAWVAGVGLRVDVEAE